MLSQIVALLICIVGLVIYAISNNGKAQTLALDCFWVGLLAFLLMWTGRVPMR